MTYNMTYGLTKPQSVDKGSCSDFNLAYVLITPARNEEAFIEETIRSVVGQTVLPVKWVIVSDGSTDNTDEIVKKHAAEHPWIEFVRMPDRAERHFAGKVHAFNAGYEKVRTLRYDIIGSLDADISFDSNYFDYLLNKFAHDPALGVAGTPFIEDTFRYDYRFTRTEHVSGACQLFRKECFEHIGGYTPLKTGGIDLVAVVTARMNGWKTQTFTDMTCIHHRRMGSAKHNVLTTLFKDGYYDYPMGVHPVWELSRTVYHMTKKPFVVSGLAHMTGYLCAMLTRAPRLVPAEVLRFRRQEQMRWLGEHLRSILGLHSHQQD